MTVATYSTALASRRQWRVVLFVAVGLVVLLGTFVAGTAAGYRVNMTASEPLGLWRIIPLERPIAVGDLVFLCPPATAQFVEARSRGYLRRGLCPTGDAPLIKMVIATAGQQVEIGADVRIDGLRIPQTGLVRVDGKGRPLHPGTGGIVPAGSVFLYSPYAASWDSRYFGAIPVSGVLGLAEEVLTYAP